MTQKLKGRAAVVTGGAGGIGRGICLTLAEEGAGVVVNDINKDAADKVVDEIKKAGGVALTSYESITTMQSAGKIIQTAIDKFGRIDILVNCAAVVWDRSIVDMTEKEWNSLLDVQIKGYFNTVKVAIPDMIRRKSGRIINFSSRAATFGSPNAAYSTAKAAILGLTVNLSVELKKYGITANTIIPSAETANFSRPLNALGDIGFKLSDGMPVTPVRDPDYIAPIVVYLATDEAKSVTAQFIYSSGGDICIYARPFQLPGPHQFLRKNGKWTVEELTKVLPTLIEQD